MLMCCHKLYLLSSLQMEALSQVLGDSVEQDWMVMLTWRQTVPLIHQSISDVHLVFQRLMYRFAKKCCGKYQMLLSEYSTKQTKKKDWDTYPSVVLIANVRCLFPFQAVPVSVTMPVQVSRGMSPSASLSSGNCLYSNDLVEGFHCVEWVNEVSRSEHWRANFRLNEHWTSVASKGVQGLTNEWLRKLA